MFYICQHNKPRALSTCTPTKGPNNTVLVQPFIMIHQGTSQVNLNLDNMHPSCKPKLHSQQSKFTDLPTDLLDFMACLSLEQSRLG